MSPIYVGAALAPSTTSRWSAESRVRDFIMDPNQTGQIEQAISEGEYYGMQTFDQALLKLVQEDKVDYEEALRYASRPQDFKLMAHALGKTV